MKYKELIMQQCRHAVEKHPAFVDNKFEQICVLTEELGEAFQAVYDGVAKL